MSKKEIVKFYIKRHLPTFFIVMLVGVLASYLVTKNGEPGNLYYLFVGGTFLIIDLIYTIVRVTIDVKKDLKRKVKICENNVK